MLIGADGSSRRFGRCSTRRAAGTRATRPGSRSRTSRAPSPTRTRSGTERARSSEPTRSAAGRRTGTRARRRRRASVKRTRSATCSSVRRLARGRAGLYRGDRQIPRSDIYDCSTGGTPGAAEGSRWSATRRIRWFRRSARGRARRSRTASCWRSASRPTVIRMSALRDLRGQADRPHGADREARTDAGQAHAGRQRGDGSARDRSFRLAPTGQVLKSFQKVLTFPEA